MRKGTVEVKVAAAAKSGASNRSQGGGDGKSSMTERKYLAKIFRRFPKSNNNTEFQAFAKKYDGFYEVQFMHKLRQ